MTNRTIISYLSSLSILFAFNAHSLDLTDYTISDTIRAYSKIRIEKYKELEKIKKEERTPIALSLDSLPAGKIIKQCVLVTKNSEFSDFKSADTLLKATISPDIVVTDVKKLSGGFVSGEIYRIAAVRTNTHAVENFFLKYLRKTPVLVTSGRCYGEQANLAFLMSNQRTQEIQNYITIILPELIAEYTDDNDEQKVFMILPEAKGESFTNIVKGENLDSINTAFSAFGFSLAQMHMNHRLFTSSPQNSQSLTKKDFINARVLAHTDLHGDNIFYCPNTQRISFIDVETMANSFDENNNPSSPIGYDLLYMLLMSPKKFGDSMPKNKWAPFEHFLKAYTDAYPIAERVGIYDYLEELFHTSTMEETPFLDLFKHFSWEKKIQPQEIKGAKKLAKYIRQLRIQFKKAQNPRPRADTKKEIEHYYAALKATQEAAKKDSDSQELPTPDTSSQDTVAQLAGKFETFIKEKQNVPNNIKIKGVSVLNPNQ